MKTITATYSPGEPVRTRGCMVLYCRRGYGVAECNFTPLPMMPGSLAVIFSDTVFSIARMSRRSELCRYELSTALADEATFISSGPFFDWLYEHPLLAIPPGRRAEIERWMALTDTIASDDSDYREVMLRNQWQNFFLGLESALRGIIADRPGRRRSSSRRIFNTFCQLLAEHCRRHHHVRFYADKLCITPYYLSRVTDREFEVSPKEMIDRQLMTELKSLLGTTHLSVTEIADICGFESASYLGRFFRRHTGMTPIRYRELQKTS